MDSINSPSEYSSSSIPSTAYSSSIDTTNTGSGVLDNIKNITPTTWLLIILILAFLGLNIFSYLEKITQEFTNLIKPIIAKLFGETTSVVENVVNVSAEGAKTVVGGTADVLQSGLSAVQDVTNVSQNNASSSIQGQPINQSNIDIMQQSTLNKALNSSKNQQQPSEDYQANEASSSISGKSGWCYIGEERGFRTCAEVGVNDTCMSGDIFPSQEICMNPKLRA